jgi:hypothetical protein
MKKTAEKAQARAWLKKMGLATTSKRVESLAKILHDKYRKGFKNGCHVKTVAIDYLSSALSL